MGAWSWLVELVRGPSGFSDEIRQDWTGVVRGRRAHVISGSDAGHARFLVHGPPRGLAVHRRSGVDDLLHVAVVTGDLALDAVARIQGDRVLALSLLHEKARAALVRALELDLIVEDGVVHGEARKPDVPELLEEAAILACELVPPDRPPIEVLAERLETEPAGAVRLAILRALLDRGVNEALTRAITDPDGAVRLLAATRAADAGVLADLALDPAVTGDLRDRAFQQLRQLDPSRLRAMLVQAITDPTRSRIALERAAAEADPSLIDAIVGRARTILDSPRVLASDGATLLRALAPYRDERVPALLLDCVERAPPGVARQALLQLRDKPPQAVLARLESIEQRRPELAIGDVRRQLETVDAGEVLAARLDLTWSPRHRHATGTLAGLPLEVRLEPDQVGFYVTGLPSALSVEGLELPPTAAALAWLPVDQRERVARLVAEAPRFGVGHGRLHAVGPLASGAALAERARDLEEVVAGFLWLAELSPTDRLEAAFAAERVPLLRRKLVAQLLAERPACSEAALDDPDPGVRTLAATRLRRADVLTRVVIDAPEAAVRRDAMSALAELGDEHAISAAVAAALGDPELRAIALTLVGRHKLRAHADYVARLLDAAPAGQEEGWVRIALQVLGVLQVPSTERHLIRALRSQDPQVRRLAILALGQVGSDRAAAPLKELAAGWRVSWEVHAARTALEAIRARAAVGGLSVAGEAGGKLALSAKGGELGVAEDEP